MNTDKLINYHFMIQGITCDSCVQKITHTLQANLNVTDLQFLHNNTQVIFNSNSVITLEQLNILVEKFAKYKFSAIETGTAIHDMHNHAMEATAESPTSYRPIYLIFTYLIVINLLISSHHLVWMPLMVNFMASFFLVFSFFKLLDLRGFADGYSTYDLIAKKWYHYGFIYPFIEIAFGIGYLLFGMNLYLNVIVFIIMFISSIGVIKATLSPQKFVCACVGTFLKVPLGSIAIIEDVMMAIMSLGMIVYIIQM